MRRGTKRVLSITGVGAGAGAVAAWIAYLFRKPEPFGAPGLSIKVDEITISDQLWCIVGLALLGGLVCGLLAAIYVSHKGLERSALAFAIAAPIGGFLCWGSRWVMDQLIYAMIGGAETRVDPIDVYGRTQLGWLVWQLCVALALTMPVVLAIGPNMFKFLRGLIGSGLAVVFGYGMSIFVSILLVPVFLAAFLSGGGKNIDATSVARFADVLYLFSLGAAAGLAFAFAEVLFKPAWLRSYAGPTEGRTWALAGEFSRIGTMEGNEVLVPVDGLTAPIHAHVQAVDESHWLADLGGGTLLNGSPVQGVWLSDNDRIGVGSHQLIYRTRLAPTGRPATRATEPPRLATTPGAPDQPSTQGAVPLIVLVDPLGNRHPIYEGVIIIGREEGCDLALTWEASVSRRHAALTITTTDLSLKDLGSTNGTFVNEQPAVDRTPLKPGDTLRLGACRLKVEAGGS